MDNLKGKRAIFDTSRYTGSIVPTKPLPAHPASAEIAEPVPSAPIPANQEITSAVPVDSWSEAEIDGSEETVNPVAPEESIAPDPAPATRKSTKSGKRTKETATNKKKERKPVSPNRPSTTIYFNNPDTHQRAWVYAKLVKKDSMSNVIVDAFEDVLNHSYQCADPACNGKFVSVSSDGDAMTPTCCPFCGGKKVRHQKTPSF